MRMTSRVVKVGGEPKVLLEEFAAQGDQLRIVEKADSHPVVQEKYRYRGEDRWRGWNPIDDCIDPEGLVLEVYEAMQARYEVLRRAAEVVLAEHSFDYSEGRKSLRRLLSQS